ncbi:hypothetical protein L9F63_000859, partial [Diploptera punctata]
NISTPNSFTKLHLFLCNGKINLMENNPRVVVLICTSPHLYPQRKKYSVVNREISGATRSIFPYKSNGQGKCCP